MKTKSYDISVDSFVNVVVPDHYNPKQSDHANVIYQIALRKFQDRLDDGDFNIDWNLRKYESHDPTTLPDREVPNES